MSVDRLSLEIPWMDIRMNPVEEMNNCYRSRREILIMGRQEKLSPVY